MLNFVLAVACGLIALVDLAKLVVKNRTYPFDRNTVNLSDNAQKSVMDYLNKLDDTRESRFSHDRSRMMCQCDGFRSEWNSFMGTYSDNFELDMSY